MVSNKAAISKAVLFSVSSNLQKVRDELRSLVTMSQALK